MQTTINDPEGGKLNIITQQYEIGLYVAVYKGKRCIEQYNLDTTEVEFHKHLRSLNGEEAGDV
jgi:hypothetical protein